MKSKIIIIALAVVCITGASFATGVAIEKHNSRETSMLVDEAVSSAVSDALNSTVTTQTITITEAEETSEPAATTAQTTTETSTTKAKKNSTITKQKTEKVITGKVITGDLTAANTSTNFTPSGGEGDRIKSSDGDYWKAKSYLIDYEYYAAEFPDIETIKNHPVYVTENGKLFYFDDNGKRIYEKDWKH